MRSVGRSWSDLATNKLERHILKEGYRKWRTNLRKAEIWLCMSIAIHFDSEMARAYFWTQKTSIEPEDCTDLFPLFTLYEQAMSRWDKSKESTAPRGCTGCEISSFLSLIPSFIYFLWDLGFWRRGRLKKKRGGSSDQLEDMMNVADENEGEFSAMPTLYLPPNTTPPPLLFLLSFFHHLAFSKSWEAIAKVNEPWPQADAPHISLSLPLSHRAFPTLHPPFPTTNLTLLFQRGSRYIPPLFFFFLVSYCSWL